MKQLKSFKSILSQFNLAEPIVITSERQNGSTTSGILLGEAMAVETGCFVNVEDLITVEVTPYLERKPGVDHTVQDVIRITTQSGVDVAPTGGNTIRSFLSEGGLAWIIDGVNGKFFAQFINKGGTALPLPGDLELLTDSEMVTGLSPKFLEARKAAEAEELGPDEPFVDRLAKTLDFKKPVFVIGRRPRQGASTFAALLAMQLAERHTLKVDLLSGIYEAENLRKYVFDGRPVAPDTTVRTNPAHFIAGLNTVQKAEYELATWLNGIRGSVILADELVPLFQVPGAAAANPVSADIFISSGQIRFNTKLREGIEERVRDENCMGIVTGTNHNPDLTIAPNTVITYIGEGADVLSLLAIGEDGFEAFHLRITSRESDAIKLTSDTLVDFSEVSEQFRSDVDYVIHYFEEMREAKAFEAATGEISAAAELAQNSTPGADFNGLR